MHLLNDRSRSKSCNCLYHDQLTAKMVQRRRASLSKDHNVYHAVASSQTSRLEITKLYMHVEATENAVTVETSARHPLEQSRMLANPIVNPKERFFKNSSPTLPTFRGVFQRLVLGSQ
jgi:hypothetical protein